MTDEKKCKRLAITISGAVSLGSFEAGVLFETIHAIGEHNSQADLPPDQRIEIDALTGASAGGMTATIAAQKVLLEPGALALPYDNALYGPWVKDVSLDGLLEPRPVEELARSLLSSDLIGTLSKRYLLGPFASGTSAPAPAHPHPAAASEIWLGLALSNLNGVDYGRPLRNGGSFVYTRREDQLKRKLTVGSQDLVAEPFWESIRQAAVSCGAFPLAFQSVELTRAGAEFPADGMLKPLPAENAFAYTDGGTFDNEPLGMAKDLVDLMDGHDDNDSRFYLFVSPKARASSAVPGFTADRATYFPLIRQLAGAILDQAQFQDWVTAEELNDRVEIFNRRALQLRSLLLAQPAAAAALEGAAKLLIPALFPPAATKLPSAETPDQARARLKRQFRHEYEAMPADIRDIWIDSILVLETAADLGTRDEMSIYGVTADVTELASHELASFAGFFDRSFRDHDYDLGRLKARAFLNTLNSGLGPIHFAARGGNDGIRPLDHSLDGLTLERMDKALREDVCRKLRGQARRVLSATQSGHPLAQACLLAVFDIAAGPMFRKLLKLEA